MFYFIGRVGDGMLYTILRKQLRPAKRENKNNDETISGTWNFVNPPTSPVTNPDASTSTKGITKLSAVPTLATNPIAVGTNDTKYVNAIVKDNIYDLIYLLFFRGGVKLELYGFNPYSILVARNMNDNIGN